VVFFQLISQVRELARRWMVHRSLFPNYDLKINQISYHSDQPLIQPLAQSDSIFQDVIVSPISNAGSFISGTSFYNSLVHWVRQIPHYLSIADREWWIEYLFSTCHVIVIKAAPEEERLHSICTNEPSSALDQTGTKLELWLWGKSFCQAHETMYPVTWSGAGQRCEWPDLPGRRIWSSWLGS